MPQRGLNLVGGTSEHIAEVGLHPFRGMLENRMALTCMYPRALRTTIARYAIVLNPVIAFDHPI